MQMELWQLETACFWYEHALKHPDLKDQQRARVLIDMADCYTWRNYKLEKAIEYAKLALDLGESLKGRASNVLAHTYLKTGQVREAQVYLESSGKESDPELIYLKGLMHYRNGAHDKANEVWKPLLTLRFESVRFHHIKQDLMKYYFEKAPYRQAN
jgi:tetratricopeptide (TPR) repeat protein